MCDNCTANFSSKSGLNHHIQSKHESIMNECYQCDYKLSQRSKIAVHKVTKHTHREDFKSDLCDYKGTTAKHLRRQIDAVHSFVPHPCQHCEYPYVGKTDLGLRFL